MSTHRTSQAIALMTSFADRTGLTSDRPRRRYLWTDAFAVCNFLGLARATGDGRYVDLALRLVDQVHHELGRHRKDDPRRGWLSGLPDAEGEAHPTLGGLRIGKPLPERASNETLDPDVEWDRDGQYFHYLTKWMHALDQVTRTTGRPTFNGWARELAATAHRAFTYGPRGGRRMVWKLSIDLSQPLMSSMGHHDPLDGFVTYTQLETTAARVKGSSHASLATATDDFAAMIDRSTLATTDPLGLGGLLADACRIAQLGRRSPALLDALLAAAATGLRHYVTQPDLGAPASHRLGFRELGLAIGLAGISVFEGAPPELLDAEGRASLAELAQYAPLRAKIESFWLQPEHRRSPTWLEHADINDVMLATSLAPEGFLSLGWAKRTETGAVRAPRSAPDPRA